MFLFYPPHSLDTESGCKEADRVGKLPGLKDHRGISSMLGYPGGKSLFGEPVSVASEKDQGAQPMRGAAAHKVAPVLLGCISERTGADVVHFDANSCGGCNWLPHTGSANCNSTGYVRPGTAVCVQLTASAEHAWLRDAVSPHA